MEKQFGKLQLKNHVKNKNIFLFIFLIGNFTISVYGQNHKINTPIWLQGVWLNNDLGSILRIKPNVIYIDDISLVEILYGDIIDYIAENETDEYYQLFCYAKNGILIYDKFYKPVGNTMKIETGTEYMWKTSVFINYVKKIE
jgi:hypothetical protein